MDNLDFSSINIRAELLQSIKTLNYKEMMPIQEQSLPFILDHKDVIAQAKTGSGKTVAFALGILEKLEVKNKNVQSLILCPTRELVEQVAKVIRQLARTLANVKILNLCGGMPFRGQASSLEYGAHIIVGTPGRVGKHLRKKTLKLDLLTMFVLDEGDRMLDMGFQEEVNAIIDYVPYQCQTLLFSATYSEKIKLIANKIMNKPVMVKVESIHEHESIEQYFYKVENSQRLLALRLLIQHYGGKSTLIFCNTKIDVKNVVDELLKYGFCVAELHGDLEQKERDDTLVRFANNSVSILVATDVAARGLDIDSIDIVVNFHISREFEVHIHRIGRTGRAGSVGIACSLYSDKEDYKIMKLAEFLNQKIIDEPLPSKDVLQRVKMIAPMVTLKINRGKKQKIGAANILGALTAKKHLKGSDVGKIIICDSWSYVAVSRENTERAMQQLEIAKLKGRLL